MKNLVCMANEDLADQKKASKQRRRSQEANFQSLNNEEENDPSVLSDSSVKSRASFERTPLSPDGVSEVNPAEMDPQSCSASDKPRRESLHPHGTDRIQSQERSRHRESASLGRQLGEEHEHLLTYEEELLFIRSNEILKQTRNSTEQCKDILVTLKFFIDNQKKVDYRVIDTLEKVQILNDLFKEVLLIVEPIQAEKKIATFILDELDMLMRSARVCLDMLAKEYGLFDITPLTLAARRREWSKLLTIFEERNPCSLPEHLGLSCRYGSELLANMRARVLATPESKVLKNRICQMNGFTEFSASAQSADLIGSVSKSVPNAEGSDASFPRVTSLMPVEPKEKDGPSNMKTRQISWQDLDSNSSLDHEITSSASSTLAGSGNLPDGEVNWFWISQVDIIPGYWATPWKQLFSSEMCLGAVSVLLKALESFTNTTNCTYVKSQSRTIDWLRAGKRTYPSYAHNSRGGVVVSGAYKRESFSAFEQSIARIELHQSYIHQVDRSPVQSTSSVMEQIGELMGLDSWLSMAGRLSEIKDGPNNLLRTLPTLVQRLMTDFQLEFTSLDRTSNDGGLQIIQTIADGLLQTLEEQNLTKAEQLFTIVGLLRTSKVGLCIARGSDTSKLADVLKDDVQVHMA